MRGDAIDDDFGRIARKGFPANLPWRTAVQRVSNIGSEHAQIEFVYTTADLFIGREANSNQSVFPPSFPVPPPGPTHYPPGARFRPRPHPSPSRGRQRFFSEWPS